MTRRRAPASTQDVLHPGNETERLIIERMMTGVSVMDTLDPRTPSTSTARFHSVLESCFSGAPSPQQMREAAAFFRRLLCSQDMPKLLASSIKVYRRQFRSDPVASALYELVRDAEGAHAGVSVVLMRHFDVVHDLERRLSAARPFLACADDGELSLRSAVDGLRELAEPLYGNYLLQLLVLNQLAAGLPPPAKPFSQKTFGQLVRIASGQPRLRALVDRDIATMRNAAAHGGVTLDVASKVVTFKDRKRSVAMTFEDAILRIHAARAAADEKLLTAYSVNISRWYLESGLLRAYFDEALPALLATIEHPDAPVELEQAFSGVIDIFKKTWGNAA